MAITPGSTRTALTGATPVTIVAAPGNGVYRHVIAVRFANIDTAAVTITLNRSVGGTSRQLDKRTGLAVDNVWVPVTKETPIILTGTAFLAAVMSGAAATTNPDAHAEFIDKA